MLMKKVLLCLKYLIMFSIGCITVLNQESDLLQDTIESSSKASGSFSLIYEGMDTGIIVSPCMQNCQYDKDGILVYSQFISDYYESAIDVPRLQYVIYIQTPFESKQIFPVKDFMIDQDTGTLYLFRETSDFELIDKIDLKDDILGVENIGEFSISDIIIDEYRLLGGSKDISDLAFDFTNVENNDGSIIIKGEASGIYKNTGKKYYIDLEWDETKKKVKTISYNLTIWDEEQDKDKFEQCNAIYDQIEQGNWSMVKPVEGMEYMWGMHGTDGDWIRVDVNHDGMPELVSQCGNGLRTDNKKPIDLIFAWNNGTVDLVYTDLFDADQFYYYSGNGNLIYESMSAANYASFSHCIFDVKWERENFNTLGFDREVLENTYEATMTFYRIYPKEQEDLKHDPDPEYWVREFITKEQFLKYYKEMTGFEFLEENEIWEYEFGYE